MWVHRQRRDYVKRLAGRKTYMTDEKLEKLQSIGFVFHAKNSGARGMLKETPPETGAPPQEQVQVRPMHIGKRLKAKPLPTRTPAASQQRNDPHVDQSEELDDGASMSSGDEQGRSGYQRYNTGFNSAYNQDYHSEFL